MITSPAANVTIPDTIVRFTGFVEAPGGVTSVIWWFLQGSNSGKSGSLFQHNTGTPDSTRISFEVPVTTGAGEGTFGVTMEGLDRDGTHRSYTATVTFTVYKKPTLTAVHGIAPELSQRSLMLRVEMDGIATYRWANLVLDPGTSSERVVDNGVAGVVSPYVERIGGNSMRLYFPDTIVPGPHRLEVRLYDSNGLADTYSAEFVIRLPELSYRLDTLPSLGGSTTAAAINATGDVAGRAFDPAAAADRAVAWRAGVLEVLDAAPSFATAIDANGRVAGKSGSCGVIWDAGATTVVRDANGQCASAIADMNNTGAVLARLSAGMAIVRGASVTPLQLDGANDLNDNDQAVGWVIYTTGGTRAAGHGVSFTVPSPFPQPSPHYPEDALRVNTRGDVLIEVGNGPSFLSSSARPKQAVSKAGGDLVILSPIFGIPRVRGTVVALRDDGSVLAFDPDTRTGFLYDGTRTFRIVLEVTPWVLDNLTGIDAGGRIIGHARHGGTGTVRAVMLTPVP